MTNKLVTIILPVYNGEKYLKRAIDSVLNQTIGYDKLTLLVINDGGTDSSSQIISNYQKKYPELIHFIDRENKGVAKTRNEAIILTETEYVTFLDQDDYLDTDFIEVLYSAAQQDKPDVISGGFRRPDLKNKIIQQIQPGPTEYGKYIIMAAWSKLHRTNFLKENNIEFFDNQFGEDHVFTVREIVRSTKWTVVDYTGYNWFYNEKSGSNTKQKGLSLNDNFSEVLKKDFDNIEYKSNDRFNYFILRTTIGYLLFSGRNASKNRFMEVYHELFELLDKEEKFSFKNKYLPFGPKGETKIGRLSIMVFMFLHKCHRVNWLAKLYCKG
ncbi:MULTISPECIES: glycosyltransferase family 2 protein [Lactococcus]|jgi:glycosyltransferase involved in cell wall biosynthesis|uniref:Glycosyltransferase family 2 protein n=1 Tax=Lactococcus lactis TaxID=1358 RepID=A0AAE4NR33_9LACT|nr:glycosyltransferase family 2 protein [Lactococcus lactis]ATY86829.1 glycosyltransferase family 2 protein [Lactococcus lactis subsp. lactis]ATZ00454.1 glycosyltransferase family 2 protein [Lactococcus lactis subsp. lactis]KLK95797.1 glycosyltransferase, exosortase G- associated [Lactococcus lactis subsp. lactis]KST91215.1 Glycosyltransferase PglI [Lactococcus lactis subsp. lactis]KST97249.1 Glycosyltransferase PglI [Lactococcus lactis subsp. lactis]